MPSLVVMSGLPATGKSTISAALADTFTVAWLRVDRIEDAMVRSTGLAHPLGPVGYEVAGALAAEQLRHGLDVVAEAVNAHAAARDGWARAAAAGGGTVVDVEVICSDAREHRRRAEGRTVDIEGHPLPTWADIGSRPYDPWDRPRLVIDTATTSVHAAVARIAVAAALDRRAS